jgi:benzoyl-CoA reductase/2-hydroxyglutaryl-CoA dehydratase subunit BcrC/BadD/HgdB
MFHFHAVYYYLYGRKRIDTMSDIFKLINELSEQKYNKYLEQAKDEGKKILGYFCSYIPEEIITALGFIPFRMKASGSKDTELADAYYSSMNCSYPRHIFDLMLKGEYAFLDGLLYMNSCDHTRRMYDNLRASKVMEDKFVSMTFVPQHVNKNSFEEYVKELQRLVAQLEKHFDIKLTDEALAESVRLHNKKRSLLREIASGRTKDRIPIKGSELLRLVMAVTSLPVEISIGILEELKAVLKNRTCDAGDQIRLVLVGSCIEEPEHLETIEELGGSIVADHICFGMKYYESDVEESGHPMQSIAKRYFHHVSCPRMVNGFYERSERIDNLIETYHADGVLAEKLKFCILFGGESFLYRKEARLKDYPLLVLEKEYDDKSVGQMKTRLQAFFEEIRNKKAVIQKRV